MRGKYFLWFCEGESRQLWSICGFLTPKSTLETWLCWSVFEEMSQLDGDIVEGWETSGSFRRTFDWGLLIEPNHLGIPSWKWRAEGFLLVCYLTKVCGRNSNILLFSRIKRGKSLQYNFDVGFWISFMKWQNRNESRHRTILLYSGPTS